MPILSDPDQIFAVVLERDENKPAATRPEFFAKACSARKQREMYRLLDKFRETADADDMTVDDLFDQTFDQLGGLLTGWKNIKSNGQDVPFDPKALEDVLTYEEARELISLIQHNQYVQEGEKKSSES